MDPLLPDEFPFSRQRFATPQAAPADVIAPPAAAPEPIAAAVAETPPTPWQSIAAPPDETAVTVAAAAAPVGPALTSQAARAATSRASVAPALTRGAMASAKPVVPTASVAASYKGPERRRSPRQALRAKAIFRGDLTPANAGSVQILNVSLTGVRVWSPKALKAGERGTVRMEVGPVKWSSRVRVVACEPQDEEGFSVGCEFAGNEVSRRVA